MEHRDFAAFDQFGFDFIALGRRDVFQVDTAERRLQFFHDIHEFFGIFGIDTDGHRIHIAEFLVEYGLAFHNGHGSFRPDVPQAQYTGPIADDSYHVAPAGIFKRQVVIFFDLAAGFGYTGGVGDGQVMSVFQRHLAAHFQFAMVFGMHFQRFTVQFFRICQFHSLLYLCPFRGRETVASAQWRRISLAPHLSYSFTSTTWNFGFFPFSSVRIPKLGTPLRGRLGLPGFTSRMPSSSIHTGTWMWPKITTSACFSSPK